MEYDEPAWMLEKVMDFTGFKAGVGDKGLVQVLVLIGSEEALASYREKESRCSNAY